MNKWLHDFSIHFVALGALTLLIVGFTRERRKQLLQQRASTAAPVGSSADSAALVGVAVGNGSGGWVDYTQSAQTSVENGLTLTDEPS